jgi:hypothetical protein
MSYLKKGCIVGTALVTLIIGMVIGMNMNAPAVAQGEKASSASRYSVVDSEGVNLIVTDNQKQTVYFYTVEPDQKPGADLHLRGTIDLNKVGDATLKPTLINPRKQ